MIKGHCNCGAVSFELHLPVKDVFICHCSICRRSTGGTGIAVTLVTNESFAWLSGVENIRTWNKPHHDWQTSFCAECGSPVPGKNDDNNMYVPASLIDVGAEQLEVTHHLFVASKAPWEEIGDSGKQHLDAYKE